MSRPYLSAVARKPRLQGRDYTAADTYQTQTLSNADT